MQQIIFLNSGQVAQSAGKLFDLPEKMIIFYNKTKHNFTVFLLQTTGLTKGKIFLFGLSRKNITG
jgi:hypothetical protein